MKLEDFVQDVNDFLDETEEPRLESERNRDYKDNKQWTDAEKAKLASRNQPDVTVNRIKYKVDGMKGLIVKRNSDPKAYPRTQKHEFAAEAVTDGLRYVADNTNFDNIKLEVADNIIVEGYGASIIEFDKKKDEITVNQIPWDRYYFDFHSRRYDFKDKRWDGIVLWMDKDVAEKTFNTTIEYDTLTTDDTFEDRPRWVDRKNNRARICQHFYLNEKNIWIMCYFTSTTMLVEPAPSPYLDEEGEPVNPIEAQTANIDRDNNRFGEVSFWIDMQKELNHRRSKYLHLLSTRQTAARRGAVQDVPKLKREMSKPDGHIEYDGEKGDFEVLNTNDMAEAQFLLYQDGKSELDAVGFNAQLSGERQGDLSGRAISNLQDAALNELSPLYNGISDWERRNYRQIWMRMKQYWKKDKWIRVTDDTSKLRWVGFNQQITYQQQLEEIINDESEEPSVQRDAAYVFQNLMQSESPKLQEIVETRNKIAELDVDIIIETTADSVNIQREQFELLANIAQTRSEVPFDALLELSELRGKKKLLKRMEESSKGASEAAQTEADTEAAEKESEAELRAAKGAEHMAKALQTTVQTEMVRENPPEDPSVII